MPIYDFRCGAGHVTELVRPVGTDTVHCAECGDTATRTLGVAALIIGPTLHPNLSMDGRWQEARERADIGFKQAGVRGH